jgi:hypothetical protein
MIRQEVELMISKCLGEYVCNLFEIWTLLQIDDPVMDQLYDVMNMDLDVFGLLSLHWVSTKLESTLIVTPNDIRMMKLDAKLSEEDLKPKFLNNDGDFSFVFVLYRR